MEFYFFYARISPMDYRAQKRVIIGLSTFIFVGFFIFLATLISPLWEQVPSGQNGSSKNGTPEELFKEIEVISVDFFEIPRYDNYDVVALIKNPNIEYGVSHVTYEFIFYKDTEEEIYRVLGETFILANQSRYVVRPALILPSKPASVKFNVLDKRLQRLAPFSPVGLFATDITVERDDSLDSTYISGIVRNTTPYNLKNVEVNAVLQENNKPIATGATNMQQLDRGAARFFKISWPSLLRYTDFDVRVESNFFGNANFIRDYAL